MNPRSLRAHLACVLFFSSATALANGRFPATNQVITRPGRPEQFALRTTFGLLRSDDAGAHWDWVCEDAIGYSGVVDPPLAWHRDGTLIAGLFDGLALSNDPACSWSRDAAIGKQVVVDVSAANAEATRLEALTGSYDPQSAPGQPRYVSAIWTSSTDGRSWAQSSTLLPSDVIVESFDRAASDAQRVYVTGESEAGGARVGVFFRSRDGGQSWDRKAFPFEANGERALFLAAIDPSNADRLYVRTNGAENGRVLVSDDAGETFRTIWSGANPQGFALSPDGARVWVGSFRDGLARAATSDFAFTTVNRTPIGCLHAAGNALFACSLDAYGFAAARSDDGGQTLVPLLKLPEIRGPRACSGAGDAGVNVCLATWPVVKASVGIVDEPDAGPVPVFDAGATPPAPAGKSSCGCAVVGAKSKSATGAGLWAAASVALLVARRRRTSP
jgi:MYXO-CTERM domain-containing protein